MYDPITFLHAVIRPALESLAIDIHGERRWAAEQLLLGTAIKESDLRHTRQHAGGPARGLFQMEPQTHQDIWKNFLAHRDGLAKRVESVLRNGKNGSTKSYEHMGERLSALEYNHVYAAAMCRVRYLRVRDPLPPFGNIDAMAAYWKQHYNTFVSTKGKKEHSITAWNSYVTTMNLDPWPVQ